MQGEMNLKDRVLNDRELMTKCLSFLSIIVLSIVFCFINPTFLSPRNILNLLKDMSPVMVMAAGQAFVLMLGSIDLSTGTMASCSAVMLTILLSRIGPWAYFVVLAFGLTAGLLNGTIQAKLGIPSFIATRSTQAIWQSLAYVISGGMPLSMAKPVWIYVDWGKVKFFNCIPLLFIVAFLVLIILSVVSRFTGIGHTVLATGANERATWLIGRNVKKAKIVAFVFSSLGACIGGILFAVKAKSGIPTVGTQYNMLSIAAAVMGGVSMSGGRGSIFMTLLGALLITMIQNGMNVIGIDALWQNIIFGALLLLAIFMNSDKNHKGLVVK